MTQLTNRKKRGIFEDNSIDQINELDSDYNREPEDNLEAEYANKTVHTEFNNMYDTEKQSIGWTKIFSVIFLIYLYLTITVKGNFIFRYKFLKYLVIFLSFLFFFFTLKILASNLYLIVVPIAVIMIDLGLILKRKTGINGMIYEVWGLLISCCWIVNLMLIMMDILLFLSNIFGVPIILFTCIIIALGNNIAGKILSLYIYINNV